MDNIFIYIFFALFSVLNPLGAVPIFIGLTQENTKKERSRISIWTAINVVIILTISFFVGEYVLKFFGISIDALRIAGGIVIMNSGFALLSGGFSKNRGVNKEVQHDAQSRSDIALTPLAIPMLAGPGSISLMIATHQDNSGTLNQLLVCLAVLAIGLSIFLILRSADYISKVLGASGIVAISRIMGFIVLAIGIQYITNSVVNIITSINF
ncbi:MAG TPA: MarC family NAAT transporter [Flavobacterium sp.]|nr:MarC family NAAT transporter [Flavobacterium sp.]